MLHLNMTQCAILHNLSLQYVPSWYVWTQTQESKTLKSHTSSIYTRVFGRRMTRARNTIFLTHFIASLLAMNIGAQHNEPHLTIDHIWGFSIDTFFNTRHPRLQYYLSFYTWSRGSMMSNLSTASRTRINILACIESKEGPSSDNYRQVHSVLYV